MARFGETRFGGHIAALQQSRADALFVAVNGDDAVAFYQQAQLAGLLSRTRVLADSENELTVPQTLGASTPEHLWLGVSWYYGGYQALPMGRQLYDDYVRSTGNAMPLGFVNAGHSAIYAYAAAIEKAGTTETPAIIKALEGLTFGTAKGRVTFRPEDHQAVCDVNFIRIKHVEQGLTMDINEGERPDIEVSEFIRLDGSDVIEPPSPGRKLAYRF